MGASLLTGPAAKRAIAASMTVVFLVAGSAAPAVAQGANPEKTAPAPATPSPAPRTAAKGPATTPTPPPELEPASGSDAVPADRPDEPADPATKPAAPAAGAVPSAKPSPPTIPAPEPGAAEAEYFTKLDQLIAGIRDFSPSPEDLQRVRDAFSKTGVATISGRDAIGQIQDPAARKLVTWAGLKSGIGEPQDFIAFIEANPSWPDRGELIRRAEEQLLTAGGSASKIREFFKLREPATGMGWAALASVHLAENNEAPAKSLAAKVWREFELPSLLEAGFLERFGHLLTEADHKRRLDRILVDQVRFSAERNQRAEYARRVIALLSEAERTKGEARLAVFLRAKLAGQMLAALPAEPEGSTDWGLAYQKVQHLRRTDKDEDAWAILIAAPTDPDLITSPDDWWSERRAAAYDALKAGKADIAYDLVKAAGPLSVNQLKDQSFMAGWLALRYLGKPELARQHFEVSAQASDGPLSKARAEYWLGRALEALGKAAEATERYTRASAQADTFHGQLSRHKLEPGETLAMPIRLPALPSAADAQRFAARDSVRAAVIAVKSGISRSVSRALFAGLRNHLDSEAELAMLAHLASALGDPQASLRIGKTAIARGKNLTTYAYPLHVFPAFTALRDPPEISILLGIARQETEFNNVIVSTAGARGLLQVMPVTAKHVCRDHKVVCNIPRLITDNGYNAMIAAAYIGDRMAEFRGNYVLTLAGYNAGPGRARQWMREFGDPRDRSVDVLDWIERIPIEETREYVKKVLSNIQVYRARLGEAGPLRLIRDLNWAQPGRADAAATPSRN